MIDHPTPTQLRRARELHEMTQKQAAALIHATERAWQSYEGGQRKMPKAAWELFQIKVSLGAR